MIVGVRKMVPPLPTSFGYADKPYGVVFSVNSIRVKTYRKRPARPELFVQPIEHRLRFFNVSIGIDDHIQCLPRGWLKSLAFRPSESLSCRRTPASRFDLSSSSKPPGFRLPPE
jgi:hypothetical protein